MCKTPLPEEINIRQWEDELDYLENVDRTTRFQLPEWLIPAFLVCSAAFLFMH